MTKKQIYELKENAAKLIFKNSNNTIHTYSKTYSGASQFFTKSLILQLKQNLPKDNYYEDNGSLKRDLSIETDYCILRTHYKKKRNTNRDTTSQKSKYSINRTEIDTIDEYNNDTSACGDSEKNFIHNTNININLTSLVVDNLKNLLNDWIRTYLLENNETKEKIETVLDSILHQLDLQRNDTPSSHTYTLDIEMDQNFHESEFQLHKLQDVHKTPRNKILKVKNKKSTLTIPLSAKHLKIISTLSLPKNIHKIRKTKSLKKFRHKRILLSTNNSSVYVFNSSNLDFLTLPTNSLIKHCATYESNKCKNLKNKSPIEKINKEIISSIYKHIAGINNFSDYESKMLDRKESLCISENDNSDPLVTVDLVRRSTERSDKENKVLHNSNFAKAKVLPQTKRKKSNVCKRRISKYRNYKNIKSKQYTYLFKKSNNYIQQEKELLQHFQSIFRYFSNYEGKHNLKLDIKVNISPMQENKFSNSVNNIDKEKLNNKNTDLETILVTDINSGKLSTDETKKTTSDIDQNIISLLDGAASQTKYIISRDTSKTTETDNKEETESVKINLKSSKVAREISELKIIVQSLATITEKLVNKHMDKKMELEASTLTKKRISKSVQFSNNVPKSQIISGLKLRKEPKKKITGEFNVRLTKRSTSYNIIDSESILRVTDMTSAAEVNTATAIDEALTCSLPKSKSLFEVSVGPEKKLLAFYCDDFIKPYPCRHHSPSYISIPRRNTCHHIQPSHVNVKYNQNDCCDVSCASGQFQPENDDCQLYDDDNSSSSCCIDIDKSCENKIKIRNRSGLCFWEGLIYCILLWIPVLLVLWLFYVYAIEEMMNPSQSKERHFRKFCSSDYASNVSKSSFNLNDLGF